MPKCTICNSDIPNGQLCFNCNSIIECKEDRHYKEWMYIIQQQQDDFLQEKLKKNPERGFSNKRKNNE